MTLEEQAAAYNWTPEYYQVQQDNEAIRGVMAAYNQPYWVTGTGSMADGGNSLAILPQMAQAAGIDPTQGMLSGYQGVVGQAYNPNTTTTYNPANDSYAVSNSPYDRNTAVANLASYYQGLGYSPTTAQTGSTNTSAQGVSGVPTGQFGGGAATGNRTPEQLATIKGTWQQFTSGQKTAAEIQQAMTQYGVNFADISAATGIPVGTLQQQLGVSGGAPQPTTPQPPANMGSPYNPGIITPNPDGSGTPYGSTHPKSGMVGGNTGGGSSYDQQLNNYYNAYFKDAPGVDQGMLSNWYDTPYNPAPTGFSTANKGASSAQGLVNSLDWGKPEWDAQSTPKLFNYMNMYGLSTADVAKSLGFTEQQIIDHFKKYGIDATALKSQAATQVVDNSTMGDGPQRSGNNRSGI